jgi:hypothetical protein
MLPVGMFAQGLFKQSGLPKPQFGTGGSGELRPFNPDNLPPGILKDFFAKSDLDLPDIDDVDPIDPKAWTQDFLLDVLAGWRQTTLTRAKFTETTPWMFADNRPPFKGAHYDLEIVGGDRDGMTVSLFHPALTQPFKHAKDYGGEKPYALVEFDAERPSQIESVITITPATGTVRYVVPGPHYNWQERKNPTQSIRSSDPAVYESARQLLSQLYNLGVRVPNMDLHLERRRAS